MIISPYDRNLEILRTVFHELFKFEEIDRDMWNKILELGQIDKISDLAKALSTYSKIRCIYDKSDDKFGFTEEFFSGEKWFAEGVCSLGTIGCLIGDNSCCIVKGYDKTYELYTVSYVDEKDISDATVPAITDNPDDFVVGIPGLVGTYDHAMLIMRKQEDN